MKRKHTLKKIGLFASCSLFSLALISCDGDGSSDSSDSGSSSSPTGSSDEDTPVSGETVEVSELEAQAVAEGGVFLTTFNDSEGPDADGLFEFTVTEITSSAGTVAGFGVLDVTLETFPISAPFPFSFANGELVIGSDASSNAVIASQVSELFGTGGIFEEEFEDAFDTTSGFTDEDEIEVIRSLAEMNVPFLGKGFDDVELTPGVFVNVFELDRELIINSDNFFIESLSVDPASTLILDTFADSFSVTEFTYTAP